MKFYLAGPFFNQPQIELIAAIELLMVDQCIPCFSPRQQHRDKTKTTIETLEQARKVFSCNVDNIDDCTHMLAVVDWLMPAQQKVCIIGQTQRKPELDDRPMIQENSGRAFETVMINPDLNLPDSGTVWEMGYAYSKEIPIILFRTKESKLNVMLTQCAEGVVTGIHQLERFMNKGILNWNEAPVWKGAVI